MRPSNESTECWASLGTPVVPELIINTENSGGPASAKLVGRMHIEESSRAATLHSRARSSANSAVRHSNNWHCAISAAARAIRIWSAPCPSRATRRPRNGSSAAAVEAAADASSSVVINRPSRRTVEPLNCSLRLVEPNLSGLKSIIGRQRQHTAVPVRPPYENRRIRPQTDLFLFLPTVAPRLLPDPESQCRARSL